MADRYECKYCGVPVAKLPAPVKFWGKGEPPDYWNHTKRSHNGAPRCDKQFLLVDEVVLSGTQVPVQD